MQNMATSTVQADTCIDQQLPLGLELGTRELYDLGLPTPDNPLCWSRTPVTSGDGNSSMSMDSKLGPCTAPAALATGRHCSLFLLALRDKSTAARLELLFRR